MVLNNFISEIPCWYILITIIFSLYFSIRDVVHTRARYRVNGSPLSNYEKYIIDYIQGFLFKSVATITSFIALWLGYIILISLESFNDISIGTAILLVFLFIWGVIGATGYLTSYITAHKIPFIKS